MDRRITVEIRDALWLTFDGIENLLEVLTRNPRFLKGIPKRIQEPTELSEPVRSRGFVDSIRDGELLLIRLPGHGFVGEEHEILDEPMALELNDLLDVQRGPVRSQNHPGLG